MLIVSRVLVIALGLVRAAAGDSVRIDAECLVVRVHDIWRGGDAGGDGGVFLETRDHGGRGDVDRSGDGRDRRVESRAGAVGMENDVDAVYPALAASVASLIVVSYADRRSRSEEKLEAIF